MYRVSGPAVLILILFFAGAGGAAGAADIAELYRQSCAACHGADGSGLAPDSPRLAAFDPPPADLTEPLFNSREPAADWFMVIKHGGAAMGLSSQMPAYEGALSDQQIDDLVGYLKQLTDTSAYPPGDLNFIRPVATIKAFPEDEFLLLSRYESIDGEDALRHTIYYARRLATRAQFEIQASRSERGDEEEDELELGIKWAFHDNLEASRLMALGLEVEIPLDDDDGSEVVIPYFSLAQGLTDAVSFQGTLRSHLPADDVDAGDVAVSGGVHWTPSPWPRSVSPGLEGTVTIPFDGSDLEATLLPQALVGLTRGGHVALALGVEVPVTGIDWDYRLHAFLLWDFADGPFWAGWR